MHHYFICCEGPNTLSPNHEQDPATIERVEGVRKEKHPGPSSPTVPRHFRAGSTAADEFWNRAGKADHLNTRRDARETLPGWFSNGLHA